MAKIIGIIPAAGKGTRLGLPYPKELLPVTYSSFEEKDYILTVIERNLELLSAANVEDAIIVINHDKEIIRTHLGDRRRGINLQYVYQETMNSREGLPDAVYTAFDKACMADLCIMLMGDVYISDEHIVDKLIKSSQEDTMLSVSLWSTNQTYKYGIVTIVDDKITGIVDKPIGLRIGYHWGAVAFEPRFWEYIRTERETFSNAMNRAVEAGISYNFADGWYYDLGTPRSVIDGIVSINAWES